MIVTTVHFFMHELLPLTINLYMKKMSKYHILFNKFQFIDQTAIKNVRQPSRSINQFPQNIASDELLPLITNFWLKKKRQNLHF